MIIFPAIDLKSGNCVRLIKGDFSQETIYNPNALAVAKQFEQDGATWLHIIDLDGAYDGNNQNIDVVKDIISNTNLNIQFGGGIRDVKKIEQLLNLGINRIILGTFAITNFENIKPLIKKYPNRIIVSVDSLKGNVTYNGWQNKTTIKTLEFCQNLESIGIKTLVYTDIDKDGMMQGPNFDDYEMLSLNTNLNLIASGGVRNTEDLSRLKEIGVSGAIIGKALYIKNMTLKEALLCSQKE